MRRTVWGTAVAALALTAVACGSSADSGSTSGNSESDRGGVVVTGDAGAGGAGGDSGTAGGDSGGDSGTAGGAGGADVAGKAGGAAGPASVARTVALGREVVRTGTMTVKVADVEAAGRSAVAVAERSGGYLEAAETGLNASSVLTLRVPPARFTQAADALARLGTVSARHFGSEDVTGDVADVQGRLAAGRASLARLRSLLDKATTVAEITALEAELNTRESELESLASRQRALTDSTALATLTVTLEPPPAPKPTPVPKPPAKPKVGGFMGGLRAGWAAFTTIVSVVLVVAGALLPFALAAAVVLVPAGLYLRRRRGRYVEA